MIYFQNTQQDMQLPIGQTAGKPENLDFLGLIVLGVEKRKK